MQTFFITQKWLSDHARTFVALFAIVENIIKFHSVDIL